MYFLSNDDQRNRHVLRQLAEEVLPEAPLHLQPRVLVDQAHRLSWNLNNTKRNEEAVYVIKIKARKKKESFPKLIFKLN